MGTPVVGYGVRQLSAGADQQMAVSAACTRLRAALAAHGIEPAMAGGVPAAARFHAALAQVLDGQAADAESESARRTELSGRAARAAALGAGLVEDTTATARGVGR